LATNKDCISQHHSTHAPAVGTPGTADMFYTDPHEAAPSTGASHWLAMQGTPCSVAGTHGADTLAKLIEMNGAINDNFNHLFKQISTSDWNTLDTGRTHGSMGTIAKGGRDGMIAFFTAGKNINDAARQSRIIGYQNPEGGSPAGISGKGAPVDFQMRYGQNFNGGPLGQADPISAPAGTFAPGGAPIFHTSKPVTDSGHRYARTDGVLSSLKYTCDLSAAQGFLHYIPYSTAPKPWRFETLQTNMAWLSYKTPHRQCLCILNNSYWTYAFTLWNEFIYNLAYAKESRDSAGAMSAAMRDVLDNAMGLDDGDPAAIAALNHWMGMRGRMSRRARARTERIIGLYEKAGYREQCYLSAKIFPLANHKKIVIDGRQGKRLPYLPQLRTYMGAAGLNDTFDPLGNTTNRDYYSGSADAEMPGQARGLDKAPGVTSSDTSWLDFISEGEVAGDRSDEFAFGYNGNACIPVDVPDDQGAFGFINLLTTHADQFFLDNITPAQESTLQPQIQIYKTVLGEPDPSRAQHTNAAHSQYNNGSSNQPETEIPIVFNTFSRASEIADFLSTSGEASGRRGFGAGIKSFTFTYDGSNPFAAKKSIKAQLKIFANDFAELGKIRSGGPGQPTYRYLDLALKTGGSVMDGVVGASAGALGPEGVRGGGIGTAGEGACVSPRQGDVAQREAPGGGTIDLANDPIEKLRFKIRAVVGISPPPTTRTVKPLGATYNFVHDRDPRTLSLEVAQGGSVNFYDPYNFGGTYVPNTDDYASVRRPAESWGVGQLRQYDLQTNVPNVRLGYTDRTVDWRESRGWTTARPNTEVASFYEMRGTTGYEGSVDEYGGLDENAAWRYFVSKGDNISGNTDESGDYTGTYRLDGGNEIQDALENSFTTLTLTPTTHSFEVDQDGRVVMTINYLAYVEDFFDSPSFNIFMDPILSQRRIFRRLQFSKLRALCDSETLENMKEEEADQVEKDKIHSLQTILRRLYEAKRVRYVKMSYAELRSFQTSGPYGVNAAGNRTGGVRIFMPSSQRGPAREMSSIRAHLTSTQGSDPSDGQTRQILARTANDMEKEYLSYFYVSDLVDVILEGIEETLQTLPTVLDEWKNKDDYPAFISDCDVEYEKIRLEKFRTQFKRFRVVLGPLEVVNPSDSAHSKVINLGQLPVSIKYFSEWLADQILSKDEASMPLPNFLNAFFNLLIRNFLNDDSCFKTPASQKIRMNQSVLTSYSDYQIKLDETSNFIGDQALLASGDHPVDSLTLATYAQNLLSQDRTVGDFYNGIMGAMASAVWGSAETRDISTARFSTVLFEDLDSAGRDVMLDSDMSRVSHFSPLRIVAGTTYPIFVGGTGNGVSNPILSLSGHNTRGGQEGHRVGGRHERPRGGGRRDYSAVQALQRFMHINASVMDPTAIGRGGLPGGSDPGSRFVDVFGRIVNPDLESEYAGLTPVYNPSDLTAITSPAGAPGRRAETTGYTARAGTWDRKANIAEGSMNYFSEDVVYTMTSQNTTLADTTYNFLVYCAGRALPLDSLRQLHETDATGRATTSNWKALKRAHNSYRIPHYTLGRQRGVVKEIKLTKTNSPGLQEVRFEQDGYDGLRQLREVYDVQVTLLCNPKIYPGIYIYIDPDGFFPDRTLARDVIPTPEGTFEHRDYNLSQFGIGGYYMVIRSENKLQEGTLQTILTAKWVASIEPDSDNPATSTSRTEGSLTTQEQSMCARARRSELLKIVDLGETARAADARPLESPTAELTTGG